MVYTVIVTLRTLPRSDGRTSVVLTREPSHPDDPEVLDVFDSSKEAVRFLLSSITRVTQQAGSGLVGYDQHTVVRREGMCSLRIRLELELPPGAKAVVLRD